MPPRIYLDHITATPLDPRVLEAMQPYFSECFGNPSSLHQQGIQARDALARARQQCAQFVNAASPDEIYFTSGGTEANNLAIKGAAFASERVGRHLVLSAVEHPSVQQSVAFLEKHGFTCTRVPVDRHGFVSPDDVRKAVTDQTTLIAVQHANHDIGAIQPIAEIGRVAAETGVPLFCDATASAGWLPIDVQTLGVNLLSFAPHRFNGPKGVGVLYRNRKARLESLIHGGGQEQGRRAGTENVPAIVGAGVAAELAERERAERVTRVRPLQQRLADGLLARIPHCFLNGPPLGERRSPINVCVSNEFIEGESQLLLLDHLGISAASGGSCVTKALKIAAVFTAIGLDPARAQGSLILTLGRSNTPEEIDYVLQTLPGIVEKLRRMSPMWDQRG